MKISKRLNVDELSDAELVTHHNQHGGFLTALIVQAIGNAMCQPDVPLVLSFGHPIEPRRLMTIIRSRLRIMHIDHVGCKVVDTQVVLEYKPWRDEFLKPEDAPQVKSVFQVRGEPWSEKAIRPLVMFDEMHKFDNNNAAVAAIAYAIGDDECHTFLQLWSDGEFQTLRDEWDNVPNEVFIGADPLFNAAQYAKDDAVKGEYDLSHPSDPLKLECLTTDGLCIEFQNDDETDLLSIEIAPKDSTECALAGVFIVEADELKLRHYLNRRAGVDSKDSTGQTIVEDFTHSCYQCEKGTNWLAPDSRCGDCTRYTPKEIRGDV